MSSLSRLALVLVLPLLAACTVYTPAEYRSLEESRSDTTRVNRASADSVLIPMPAPKPRVSDRSPVRAAGVRSRTTSPAAFNAEEQPRTPRPTSVPATRGSSSEG